MNSKENYKVSIIVPVYNTAKYLKKCVNSLIAQTYPNVEILLVNDGSTDGSGALCDWFANKYPQIKVFHKENGGLSDARNVGVDQACGKYISFVPNNSGFVFVIGGFVMNSLFD